LKPYQAPAHEVLGHYIPAEGILAKTPDMESRSGTEFRAFLGSNPRELIEKIKSKTGSEKIKMKSKIFSGLLRVVVFGSLL
jgi:hypothetical protein